MVKGLPLTLAPGAKAPIRIVVDLQNEQDFVGDVEIRVDLIADNANQLAFRVPFSVVSRSENSID